MTVDLSTLPTPALVFLGVVAAAQLTLQIVALVMLVHTPRERVVFGQRWPWVLIIVLGSLIGSVVFLAAGRRGPGSAEEPIPEPAGDAVTRTVRSLYGDRPA